MKRMFRTGLILLAAAAAACAPRERTLVLLSTNDMHAKIQNFPRLAAAVEACRDTAQLVVLVDAGDRWTGNAYVDMAQKMCIRDSVVVECPRSLALRCSAAA